MCQGEEGGFFQEASKAAAAVVAASCVSLLPLSGAALASEFDILTTPKPTSNYVIDDAKVVNISTERELNKRLAELEVRGTGTVVIFGKEDFLSRNKLYV